MLATDTTTTEVEQTQAAIEDMEQRGTPRRVVEMYKSYLARLTGGAPPTPAEESHRNGHQTNGVNGNGEHPPAGFKSNAAGFSLAWGVKILAACRCGGAVVHHYRERVCLNCAGGVGRKADGLVALVLGMSFYVSGLLGLAWRLLA